MNIQYNIDIPDEDKRDIEKRLLKLILEYGTRKDNYHVGSGLGGNDKYFWFLYKTNIVIDKFGTELNIENNKIFVDYNFIIEASRDDVRLNFDERLSKVVDTDFMNELQNVDDISIKLLFGKNIDLNLFSKNDLISLAFRVADLYSSFLDDHYNSISNKNIQSFPIISLLDNLPKDFLNKNYAKFLSNLDIELSFFSVRKCIGINRIISHDLDTDPYIGPIFYKINSALEK